jgi:hypothetical protein
VSQLLVLPLEHVLGSMLSWYLSAASGQPLNSAAVNLAIPGSRPHHGRSFRSNFATAHRAVRASGDLHKMMDAVRSDLIRNLANMTNKWV